MRGASRLPTARVEAIKTMPTTIPTMTGVQVAA
jgi:hypothetical protein